MYFNSTTEKKQKRYFEHVFLFIPIKFVEDSNTKTVTGHYILGRLIIYLFTIYFYFM